MKSKKLFLALAIFNFTLINTLEKPEGSEVDPITASLKHDVDTIKAEGKLGPLASEGRAAETQRLGQRYLELGLKTDKTEAEKKEFNEIGAELKSRMGSALSTLLPSN